VLMHHLTAFGENNLDKILLDYTEQSTIFTDKGTIKGLEQIRLFFIEMFRIIPTDSFFELKQLTISETVAHIIWLSKSEVAEIQFGTDTFFISDRKILFHTVSVFTR